MTNDKITGNKTYNIQNDLYRIEFNEKQQAWHHDAGSHDENTYGWQTIAPSCTTREARFLEAYTVSRAKMKGMDTLTSSFAKKCFDEILCLIKTSEEYGINFSEFFASDKIFNNPMK